ncbi:trefoil factor 2 [Choloepus didactylus]|uniref:trefoil factor 2 n=1 Tax=Choloepus didactylus TaxID=27675 RepID=UPI0018A07D51|nr:trefoil factor 2 [Choloepus didactylus]
MEHRLTCILAVALLLTLGTLAQEPTETCTMLPRERRNCGEPGITPAVCRSRGCCFDNTVSGFPWCFHPLEPEIPEEGFLLCDSSIGVWPLQDDHPARQQPVHTQGPSPLRIQLPHSSQFQPLSPQLGNVEHSHGGESEGYQAFTENELVIEKPTEGGGSEPGGAAAPAETEGGSEAAVLRVRGAPAKRRRWPPRPLRELRTKPKRVIKRGSRCGAAPSSELHLLGSPQGEVSANMRLCSTPLLAALLVLGLYMLVAGQKPSACRCSRITPKSRKNCGFPGITSDQCFTSGCCFDSSVRGVPWCFTPLPEQESEECVMEVTEREDCGYPGISSQLCAARNCCFSDTTPQVPWCFHPLSAQDCHY